MIRVESSEFGLILMVLSGVEWILMDLRGFIYEDKIISLIKEKSKRTKKTISIKEAEEIIKGDRLIKKISKQSAKKETSRKAKKAIKSSKKIKKIRKK